MQNVQRLSISIVFLWQMFAWFSCGLPKDFIEFYNLPERERLSKFETLPIEKQIDYHLYAMSREPPDITFSEMIAARGDLVIPPLLRRIKNEREDYRKVHLLAVVADFCRLNDCKTRRPDIIESVEREVRSIKHPEWRQISELRLSIMKGGKPPLPDIR